jgi:hypothetical protein
MFAEEGANKQMILPQGVSEGHGTTVDVELVQIGAENLGPRYKVADLVA